MQKNCDSTTVTLTTQITTITNYYETCKNDHSSAKEDLDKCNSSLRSLRIEYDILINQKNRCESILTDCKNKTSITCESYYITLIDKWKICKAKLLDIDESWKKCETRITNIRTEWNNCKRLNIGKDTECQTRITQITINIRNEEQEECKKSITEITNNITTINNYWYTCKSQIKTCEIDLEEYKEYRKYKAWWNQCKSPNNNKYQK